LRSAGQEDRCGCNLDKLCAFGRRLGVLVFFLLCLFDLLFFTNTVTTTISNAIIVTPTITSSIALGLGSTISINRRGTALVLNWQRVTDGWWW
jgi:hypothetical protein